MRITTVVVLALFLIISCENPQDLSNEQTIYKGQVVQNGPAPFLQNGNSLAKDGIGLLALADEIPNGIVYGLDNDPTVYAAEGGEILPIKSWVGNENAKPLEVSLSSKLAIRFETLTKVTIVEALNMIYVDENGAQILFSGSGIITTTEISTGSEAYVTMISSAEFSIGGEGGDWG
ncbi:MAG: hypothetical protein HOB70_10730 [Chloroflexi bacterium]|jgi:hypothetical protein|nr:hypothetical protein [Candidatus Neomarinimicrobiota bacterium]MBT4683498.1 hypothetical protein [Chloroflexota bacterium]MBT6358543.1 hypothetical protein [Chloroflexota bacterium]